MELVIFILYLILFAYLLIKIPFFKNSGIGAITLITLFNLKVVAGCAYAKFYKLPKYYPTSDTWRFYRLSLDETKQLVNNPISFTKDLFTYGYTSSGNLLQGENSYWNDLKSNVPVKLLAICNVFTNSSYYTDIILFNFLFLIGLVALFKLFILLFPAKKWSILFGVFLLPSTLFWCSGIHKDGLILSAIGVFFYTIYKLRNTFSIRYTLLAFFSALLLFSLRNYILFAMLPAFFCWTVAEKFQKKGTLVFFVVYAVGILCFFLIPHVVPSLDFPNYIVNKRSEFLHLSAGSKVTSPELRPTATGFFSFLPYAVDIILLRPKITDFKNVNYLPAILENLLLFILIVVSLFHLKKHFPVAPIILCLFAVSLSILLICGYTVPFIGAIVRYKAVALPLLITPLLCMSDVRLKKVRGT